MHPKTSRPRVAGGCIGRHLLQHTKRKRKKEKTSDADTHTLHMFPKSPFHRPFHAACCVSSPSFENDSKRKKKLFFLFFLFFFFLNQEKKNIFFFSSSRTNKQKMGFEFQIGHQRLYFSYSWGTLSKKVNWHICDDMFDKTGIKVAERIASTIENLQAKGYVVGTPDPDNKNWYMGVSADGTTFFPDEERIPIFMYLLLIFKDIALQHPKRCFRNLCVE
jgi:hypothetical protein